MYVNWQTIITAGGVVSALSLLIGLIIKAHNLVLEIKAAKQENAEMRIDFEERIYEMEKHYEERISKLERHHEADVQRINEENCLVCFALSACLDGLQQLGANHEVPGAKEKLDKYLNQQAHK